MNALEKVRPQGCGLASVHKQAGEKSTLLDIKSHFRTLEPTQHVDSRTFSVGSTLLQGMITW